MMNLVDYLKGKNADRAFFGLTFADFTVDENGITVEGNLTIDTEVDIEESGPLTVKGNVKLERNSNLTVRGGGL